ncbi:hypothetical protein LTR53_006838 [Teratosphaeriaceae sp. CCFEE 6253]|nr:hypothetical protein LTR53_006838 [Teratosphaeriaceae sp. CCFEE 6253]
MSDQVTLFDLANKKNVMWNPNVMKSHGVLNFKSIPYQTEWVEYPDLEAKLSALGVPPNGPEAFASYTCPAIRLPDGSYIMESLPIANKLETLYPSPSLLLESGLHKEADKLSTAMIATAGPEFLVSIADELLREPAGAWFRADRLKRFGATLDDIEANMGGEKGWPAVEALLVRIKTLLTSHKKDEGPFILGSTPGYGDLILAALFESLPRIHAGRAERILKYDGSFGRVHEGCKAWLEKED